MHHSLFLTTLRETVTRVIRRSRVATSITIDPQEIINEVYLRLLEAAPFRPVYSNHQRIYQLQNMIRNMTLQVLYQEHQYQTRHLAPATTYYR